MNDVIEELLQFDGLSAAERVTGKDYKEDGCTEALGLLLHVAHGAKKNALLRATDDTAFGSTLTEYMTVAESLGFRTLLELPFSKYEGVSERYFVMWSNAGYLLSFDTYSHGHEASINGGKFYYNLDIPEEAFCGNPRVTSSGGFERNADLTFTWVGNHDCREALRHKVNKLNPYVLPVWKHVPFLWLLHHGDDHTENKSITRDRLAMCGEVGSHILSIMGSNRA